MTLPKLPSSIKEFVPYLNNQEDITTALKPYKEFEFKLREVYAQDRSNLVLEDDYINIVPIFKGYETSINIRGRDINQESEEEQQRYLLSLSDEQRKPHGSPAIVQSFREFQTNFNLFSESALADLDWSNVVAAGSSAVTPLLPVPNAYEKTKRALR